MPVSNDNIRVMITIPKDIKNRIDILAKKDKRSISNFISKIIIEYIESLNNTSN